MNLNNTYINSIFTNTEKIWKFKKNSAGVDYVVGDIHGCFKELEDKLHEIGFDTRVDRLFSVGDLVDRGLESERALPYFTQLEWFFPVLGNHELMAVQVLDGAFDDSLYIRNGGTWFLELPKAKQIEFVEAIVKLPLAIQVETDKGTIGIVHAHVPCTNWTGLSNALEIRDNVYDAVWERDGIVSDAPIEGIDCVIMGHTPLRLPTRRGNRIYIDTGAVFGNGLTLERIDKWL